MSSDRLPCPRVTDPNPPHACHAHVCLTLTLRPLAHVCLTAEVAVGSAVRRVLFLIREYKRKFIADRRAAETTTVCDPKPEPRTPNPEP